MLYSFLNYEPVTCYRSDFNCCFLSCIQVSQETSMVVCSSQFLKNFPQFVVIHTFKGFIIVNEAVGPEFLAFSYFSNDPMNVGNLITCSTAFSKLSLHM